MERSEILAAFSDPSAAGVVPAPVADGSSPRRLRDAIEPIAMHSVWSAGTHDRMAGFGLDFMGAYVQSRAALLGRPEPGVVAAAFAVFEPTMIASVFEQGRGLVDPDDLLAARLDATSASLAGVLSDVDVRPVADDLRAAVHDADGTGRPLFSGLAGRPWPSDPVGVLWRACEQIREHRGDSHVAVCVGRGLGPVEMNVLTELWLGMPLGSYSSTRGWSPEQIAATADRLRVEGLMVGDDLSPSGRTVRDEIEAATDVLEQPIVDRLGSRLEATLTQLNEWSARCVAEGQFPDNPFKRAAG